MVDIITSIIAHCKADATLVALLPGSTYIATEFDVTNVTLPQIAVSEVSRTREYGGPIDATVRFWVRSATRSSSISIRNRLAVLFNEGSHYTISTGGDALVCAVSDYISGEALDKDDAIGAFDVQEDYRFLLASQVA